MSKSAILSSDARVSKNTRNKVRKACDSCRKRKIKCTGTQPCSSCQAYNCECVFRGKVSSNINVTRLDTTSLNRSYSNHYSSPGTENISNQAGSVANGYPQQNISSMRSQMNDSAKQPDSESLGGVGLNRASSYPLGSNTGYMSINSTTSTQDQQLQLKDGSAGDSTSSSSSEQLKDQTGTSISSTEENNNKRSDTFKKNIDVYKSNSIVEQQITNLDLILNRLTALEVLVEKEQDSRNAQVPEVIKSIKEQLAQINKNWQPQLDLNQYKEVNKRAVKSMETYLLKNKYSETVPITKFAICGDKQLEQTLINSDANNLDNNAQLHVTQYPVVDEMFGLYSAYELFSLRGIGACFTKLIEKKEHCAGVSKSMKETLYLTLRFFDMAMSHFHVNSVSIGNPIESYLQMKKIPIPRTPTSHSNSPLAPDNSSNDTVVNNQGSFINVGATIPNSPSASSSASGSSLSSVNTKALVAILIKMLPQPFVENHTGISNKQLLESMYDDILMFKLLLEMYAIHIESIDKFMRETSAKIDSNFGDSKSMNGSKKTIRTADTHKILNFADEGEILLALMYTYYNSTLYTYFNPDSSLEYLELLIRLMDQQVWTEDKHGYHKVLGSAIQRALNMGLSRWEYYVGLDEFYAERKRAVWWKLYCHEKGNSLKSGVTSVINDNIMTCLLPKCFRDVGFLDNRDFLERVTEVKRDEIFDRMSIDCLVTYGKTSALQIYSEYHLKVLLNERYTSIRNASLPPRLKTERFREILEQNDITQKKLTAVKEQVKKLFEIAENPSLYESLLSKEDIIKAMKFCIYFANVFAVVISTLDNLDARFSSRIEDSSLSLMPHLLILLDYWRSISQILLRFDDTYTINDSYIHYLTILIIMMTHNCELIPHLTLEDLAIIFRIFGKLSTFPILTENEKYHQITDSNLFKSYCRTLSITALYCNMILKSFPLRKGMKEEELIKSLENIAPEILALTEACANPKAWPYRYLMRPVAKSGFHIKIKKMLNYIGVKDSLLEDNPSLRNNSVGPLMTGPNNSNSVMMRQDSPISAPSFPKKHSLSSTRFSLTPTVSTSGSTLISESNNFKTQDHLIGALPTGQPQEFSAFDGTIDTPAYNIGTLDEFVENNDLTDLYDALWGDLYTNN